MVYSGNGVDKHRLVHGETCAVCEKCTSVSLKIFAVVSFSILCSNTTKVQHL